MITTLKLLTVLNAVLAVINIVTGDTQFAALNLSAACFALLCISRIEEDR